MQSHGFSLYNTFKRDQESFTEELLSQLMVTKNEAIAKTEAGLRFYNKGTSNLDLEIAVKYMPGKKLAHAEQHSIVELLTNKFGYGEDVSELFSVIATAIASVFGVDIASEKGAVRQYPDGILYVVDNWMFLFMRHGALSVN